MLSHGSYVNSFSHSLLALVKPGPLLQLRHWSAVSGAQSKCTFCWDCISQNQGDRHSAELVSALLQLCPYCTAEGAHSGTHDVLLHVLATVVGTGRAPALPAVPNHSAGSTTGALTASSHHYMPQNHCRNMRTDVSILDDSEFCSRLVLRSSRFSVLGPCMLEFS